MIKLLIKHKESGPLFTAVFYKASLKAAMAKSHISHQKQLHFRAEHIYTVMLCFLYTISSALLFISRPFHAYKGSPHFTEGDKDMENALLEFTQQVKAESKTCVPGL